MQRLGPFSQNLVERQVRLADAAWEVLSNSIKTWVYNKELDSFSENHDSWRQRSAGFRPRKPHTTPRGMNESTDSSSESETYSPTGATDKEDGEANKEEEEADDPSCIPDSLRAAYRYRCWERASLLVFTN